MTRLLASNDSYRANGAIDQASAAAVQAAAGATVEVITLREAPIELCLNCRHCTRAPGTAPGTRVHQDCMHEPVGKIEAADAYILASPTNCCAVTAIFKRFMERLVVYAYWPWGAHAPKFRQQRLDRRAILTTSSAAPGPTGRAFYSTLKQLRQTARTVGARPVGATFIGLMSQQEHPVLPDKARRRVQDLVGKLL